MLKADEVAPESIVEEYNVEIVSIPWADGYVKKLFFAVASVE